MSAFGLMLRLIKSYCYTFGFSFGLRKGDAICARINKGPLDRTLDKMDPT